MALCQKLLQAERNVRFLMAKQGVAGDDACAAILGCVFLGPAMNGEAAALLYRTLKHYRTVLPCLWALQQEKRLLTLQVVAEPPSVGIFRMGLRLDTVELRMNQRFDALDQRMDQRMEHLEQMLAVLVKRDEERRRSRCVVM
jgi:hypothetical protein